MNLAHRSLALWWTPLMMTACNMAGVADSSAEEHLHTSDAAKVALNAPSNLTATGISRSQIRLTWSDRSTGENGFYVERSTSGGSFTRVGTAASGATSYVDTQGLSACATYSYRVRAFRTSGGSTSYSPYSSTVSAQATATSESACGDGTDDDCDGALDCADSDCQCGCPEGTIDVNGDGTLCQAPQSVTQLVLFNADTDQAIGTMTNGMTIDLAALGTSNLNVRADTNPMQVGSVQFVLDGAVVRTENTPPYALGGDDTSGSVTNYRSWTPSVGSHTLVAKPYSGSSASGTLGTSLTVAFTVTTAAPPTCATGYTLVGSSCVDINECNATNDCDALAGCINDPGTYHCGECPVGYTDVYGDGTFCQADAASDQYYFAQDYAGVTLYNGNSSGTNKRFANWDLYGATSFLGEVPYAWEHLPPYSDIRMCDTCDGGRRALRFEVTDVVDPTSSGVTRTQFSMQFAAGTRLPVYRTSHRMYLSPDFDKIKNYPGTLNETGVWVDLFETWMNGDGGSSQRISLYLRKSSTVPSNPYWYMRAQKLQPSSSTIWAKTSTAPVPFGKWFTIDIMVVDGIGQDGKVRIRITPDGEPTYTVYEFNDTTIHPDYPQYTRMSWQPYKFYFGPNFLNWMADNGGVPYAYYNDFKWHKTEQ